VAAAAGASALAFLLPACSGSDEGERSEFPPITTMGETQVAAPQEEPQARIRILDGDTGKLVRRARLRVRGTTVTAEGGIVHVDSPGRATAVVSAARYASRRVKLDLRERRQDTVKIWRPALQWPMYGANPARTQVHPGIKLKPPFKVVWRRELKKLVEFPAVVWEGTAYVNTINGFLRAISVETGRVRWKRRIGTLMASSPAIDPKRRVLVTTTMEPGDMKVIDMETGRVRWREAIGRSEPSPVIRKGIAYVGDAGGDVYAIDLDRRRVRWAFHGGVKITSSMTLAGNRVFFGDYAGRVFALNARTGRVLWRGSAGSRVYGTLAYAKGRVYAPSVFSGLSALSARNGLLLWRFPVGAYMYSSPAAFRGRVYVGTYAGAVYSLDASSGRVLWTGRAGGQVSGAVQVVAGVVYAGVLQHRITAWNWRNGRRLWSFPHGQYVPVSGNGSRLILHGKRTIFGVVPRKRP
jgi:outer membrane protein assembly factor BamB